MEQEENNSRKPANSAGTNRMDSRFRILFIVAMALVILSQVVDNPDAENNPGRYLVSISLITACIILIAYVIYFAFLRKKRKK